METITWDEFERIELRVGTIIAVEAFAKARKPAFKLTIDFGEEIGIKRSSSQLTALYSPETLMGRQIVAVVNFPPKQVGPFISEVLVTGFVGPDGEVTLAGPDRPVPNGSKLL